MRSERGQSHPALELACRSAEHVVPLFVLDEGLRFAVPNRARFLRESLADLHFGCLSPLELAVRAGKAGGEGGEAYVRQLCWREDADALDAWKNGRTGFPIVDAGMRQLAAEGFMLPSDDGRSGVELA